MPRSWKIAIPVISLVGVGALALFWFGKKNLEEYSPASRDDNNNGSQNGNGSQDGNAGSITSQQSNAGYSSVETTPPASSSRISGDGNGE